MDIHSGSPIHELAATEDFDEEDAGEEPPELATDRLLPPRLGAPGGDILVTLFEGHVPQREPDE